MTAAMTADTGFAAQVCGCGCPRSRNKVDYQRGAWRYTACRTCPRGRCAEFTPRPAEEAQPDAATVDLSDAAAPTPADTDQTAGSPGVVVAPPAGSPSAVAATGGARGRPARRRSAAAPLAAQVAAACADGRISLTRAPAVLHRWHAWQCEDCDRRYVHPYATHGAPRPCAGELVPVTVTITRRTVMAVDG